MSTGRGDAVDDTAYGGNASDVIAAGIGHDLIHGGNDSDHLGDENRDDTVFGDAETTRSMAAISRRAMAAMTGSLADTATTISPGNDGHDLLYGDGNDALSGGEGFHLLFGGQGNDVLAGSLGNDTFYGGMGTDTLYFYVGDTSDDARGKPDTIGHFDGDDTIRLFGRYSYVGADATPDDGQYGIYRTLDRSGREVYAVTWNPLGSAGLHDIYVVNSGYSPVGNVDFY
jgi:Ca2+-binding RTX toxin-like protein